MRPRPLLGWINWFLKWLRSFDQSLATTTTTKISPRPPPTPNTTNQNRPQTVANFYLAFEQDLTLLPVLNKIDLPASDPDRILGQLEAVFDLDRTLAVKVSAKTGEGLDALLPAIIEWV